MEPSDASIRGNRFVPNRFRSNPCLPSFRPSSGVSKDSRLFGLATADDHQIVCAATSGLARERALDVVNPRISGAPCRGRGHDARDFGLRQSAKSQAMLARLARRLTCARSSSRSTSQPRPKLIRQARTSKHRVHRAPVHPQRDLAARPHVAETEKGQTRLEPVCAATSMRAGRNFPLSRFLILCPNVGCGPPAFQEVSAHDAALSAPYPSLAAMQTCSPGHPIYAPHQPLGRTSLPQRPRLTPIDSSDEQEKGGA